MNIPKLNMNALPQYNICPQTKRRPSNTEIHTYCVEGVDIPVEEDAINNLDLKICRRYRNLIVTRCNYIIDLKKYANINTFEHQTEKHTLNILLQKYEPVLKALEAKERVQEKRRQKIEEEQKFQKARKEFTKTKICRWCFDYREKISWCLYTCQICGRQDDTSNDSGYM
jgi:hypothetical protein